MFRTLARFAAVTAVAATFLGTMATAPAQAGTAEGHIVIGFQEAPVTAGTYALDGGGDAVASITGTIDGVDVTGSSCEVSPPALATVAGGASTLIAACAGSDVQATLAPQVNPDGTITGDGSISLGGGRLRIRINCWWIYEGGNVVGFDCSFSVRW